MSRRTQLIGLALLAVALLTVLALALRGLQSRVAQRPPATTLPAATAAAPTNPPRPRPDYTPVPAGTLAPVVVQRAPARGEELPPDGAIQLVFDRAMDQATVARAFSVSPGVQGSIEWPDARTLRFRPSAPLARSAAYDVVLGQGAQAQDGASLNEAYQFRFNTSGFLEAAQVIPAPGTSDAQASSAVTVVFNRPVVALVNTPDMSTLPNPLRLEPAVSGKGAWLNTSIYVFRPDQPLASGTTYTGIVDAGLSDTVGNPLKEAFRWQFTVAAPQVISVFPQDNTDHISVEPVLRVQFNQALDPGAAAALSLSADGQSVPGTAAVQGDSIVFTPTQRLQFDRRYSARVAAGATGVSGGAGLAQDVTWSFTTVPLPRIIATAPADGERNALPVTDFSIKFNTVMSPATIMRNLRMTPPLSPTQVFTYFDDYNYSFHLNFGVQPSTEYEVQLGPDMADPYGNTIGQASTVRFRTGPLPPFVTLVAPDYVATYNADDPARIVLNSVNAGQAGLTLYRVKPTDLFGYRDWNNQPPPTESRVRQWTVQLDAPLDTSVNTRVDLKENGGALDPGVYLLVLKAPQQQWDRFQLLVVSSYNLTLKAGPKEALVWANRLRDGTPAAGLPLLFYDANGTQLGSATSDQNGIARVSISNPQRQQIFVLAPCDAAPCSDFAAIAEGWSNGINPGEIGIQQEYGAHTFNAYVYTDRPIYRPGQDVDFKGIVRNDNDVRYSLPQGVSVEVTITNPNGEQVYQQTPQLSPLGVFADKLTLAAGAALGSYTIQVKAGDEFFNFPFTVAAYRPPEFQVQTTTSASEVVRGSAIDTSIAVSYFFGGPVANVPVQWNVLAEPYRFNPPGLERYSFSGNDNPWACFDCWWQPQPPPSPIAGGSGTTDAQGRLALGDLQRVIEQGAAQSTISTTQSLRLIIEATATGKDNQAIAGRSEIIAHAAEVYVGLAARGYLAQAGQPVQVDLVAADKDGKRRAGQVIDVDVQRVEWENRFVPGPGGVGGSWQSAEKRSSVATQSLTSDAKGEATASFTPDKGGSYRIIARARDGGGRVAESSLFVWVAGSDFIPWLRENNDRLSLISDRSSYKPGETADILIPSPFQGPTWALVTVERGGILQHEVFQLQSNSAVYRLPLKDEFAPNIFVSVVLFTGPVAGDNPGLADHKIGYLPLRIEPVTQSLNVTLTPDNATTTPGSTVNYQVQVTDAGGAGVAADLSLDLVDKAVLSLLPRTENAIRQAFYGRRNLSISTSSGMSVSANRLLAQLEERLKDLRRNGGGVQGGMAGGGPVPAAAPAATAAPAAAELEQRAGAANDMAAQAPAMTVRQEFADTAFWQAEFSTDAGGRGTVQIKLPDNLTTWTLRGVGLTAETRVGEGTVEVLATKPLLIRPVTPRFFVVGDKAELAANVSNNTDQPLRAEVALAATGLSVTTAPTLTVDIPARGETQVKWNVEVKEETKPGSDGGTEQAANLPGPQSPLYADLVFSAVAGNLNDAAKPRLATGPNGSLPIYRYNVPETVGTGGQLTAGGARTEIIGLPPDLDLSRGEVTVQLDPSLAAGMRNGLSYLEHFEYECTEQTVSRFLPNVLTYRALKELGISNPDLEARLPDLVKQGVEKLALRQNGDGGWGWWPDRESNPQISAYVVLGLLRAREAGFTVNGDMFNRGVVYLQNQIKSADVQMDNFTANQQAFLLYVLGESGQGNRDAAQALLKLREKLSLYARAFLALALQRNDANDPGIKTILSDLNNSAIMSATGAHWEEDSRDWWAMNTDTRTTAIVLHALTRLDAQNQLNPNVVRWLMVARKAGVWETTQETAWALIGLTDWMRVTGELKGSYDYAFWLNDAERAAGRVEQAGIDQPIVQRIAVADLLKDAGNRLTIGRGDGPGVLYYTAHLRSFLPVEQVKALDRGIIVRRRYSLASCTDGAQCPEVKEVRLGDVIRVDLTIIAPNDLYYLRVEDPLPAGAEAVDTGLATTSLLAQGPELSRPDEGRWGWWWRWYSRSELRDDKVALFADYLAKGTYEYSYTMRATTAGTFNVVPTSAGEFYFPEVYGRGDGAVLTVR